MRYSFLIFLLILFLIGKATYSNGFQTKHPASKSILQAQSGSYKDVQGALIGTRFQSFEELKQHITIGYFSTSPLARIFSSTAPGVYLIHDKGGKRVTSQLVPGVSEKDVIKARDGSIWDKLYLAINSPFFVIHRKDLLRVFILARRRGQIFGVGDIAFYDLAETMMHHIDKADLPHIPEKDLSEKGFINTFNHITSQAFMTTLFSEEVADYVADIHERATMPALMDGQFTQEQIDDLENGPLDNYVDIINNEWGQELGKQLATKYNINRSTEWTPELLANYLNDVQSYFSWSFQIGFQPFDEQEELIVRFAAKINRVMSSTEGLK